MVGIVQQISLVQKKTLIPLQKHPKHLIKLTNSAFVIVIKFKVTCIFSTLMKAEIQERIL
jgi:hypothetical protein